MKHEFKTMVEDKFNKRMNCRYEILLRIRIETIVELLFTFSLGISLLFFF